MNIWDEKPKSKEFWYYDEIDMDGWLVKLKAQWELERKTIDLINDGLELANAGLKKKNDKLEAIREVIQKFDDYVPGGEMWDAPEYTNWLYEIKKILGDA